MLCIIKYLLFSQLVTNCRTGKADEALSFWFLIQWLLGDVTNLIGALLTRQLATQVEKEREREREKREREGGGREGVCVCIASRNRYLCKGSVRK